MTPSRLKKRLNILTIVSLIPSCDLPFGPYRKFDNSLITYIYKKNVKRKFTQVSKNGLGIIIPHAQDESNVIIMKPQMILGPSQIQRM